MLALFPDNVRKNSIVRQNLRRKREEEHRGIGDEKSTGRSNQIWERTPRKRAPVHLVDPAQARGKCSIGAVTMREDAQPSTIEQLGGNGSLCRRLQNPVQIIREERIHLRVVLFGLERA